MLLKLGSMPLSYKVVADITWSAWCLLSVCFVKSCLNVRWVMSEITQNEHELNIPWSGCSAQISYCEMTNRVPGQDQSRACLASSSQGRLLTLFSPCRLSPQSGQFCLRDPQAHWVLGLLAAHSFEHCSWQFPFPALFWLVSQHSPFSL